MPQNNLAIVIPIYNPLHKWELSFKKRYDQIVSQLGFKPDVYLVFDGNFTVEDKQLNKLDSSFNVLGYEHNMGKGYALRYGVAQTHHDFVIYTDNDFPYSNDSFISIFEHLKNGADVAVGIKDKSYYEQIPVQRKRISMALRKLIKLFFKLQITDTQCGLKGFNNKGKTIFLQTTIDRYLFDLEFIYDLSHLKENKLKVVPIEIRLMDNIVFRKMNVRLLLNQCIDFIKILFK